MFRRSPGSPSLLLSILLLLTSPPPLPAAELDLPGLPLETFRLENGMTFHWVQRPGSPLVAAGWVVRAGSAREEPGATGLAHLIEHLMFHGSGRIGTRNWRREQELMEQQDELQARIRDLQLAGEGEEGKEIEELQRHYARLYAEERRLMVKGEYARIYTEAGALGMNAATDRDRTLYYVLVPAGKLELWFWMESDRLLEPAFREFYEELPVVEEERRLRIESTPTGPLDEKLEALFWGDHPYSWPPVGWPQDFRRLTRPQARDFFAAHYAPGNLAAVLVGDLDPEEVKALARRYFGRLSPAPLPPPLPPYQPPERPGERRISEACPCQPQVRVLYPTVPFGHPDAYILDVLAGVLNGRTGRLHRTLVLERGVAFAAFVQHEPRRWAGSFTFSGETKGGAPPHRLIGAWDGEMARLGKEGVPEPELQKVKNQLLADAYRKLRDPLALLLRLLIYDALGDPGHLHRWPQETQAVTSQEIQRVIKTYLTPERRTVGLYVRHGDSEDRRGTDLGPSTQEP